MKHYSHKRNYRWLIPWIAGFVLALLVLIIGIVVFVNNRNRVPVASEPQSIFATPIPTTVVVTPTTVPTILPTPTMKPIGEFWLVKETYIGKVTKEGVEYDVFVFANENRPDITMKANCMAPSWPAPVVGDRYLLNQSGILTPCGNQNPCVTGDETSRLQRFMPIKE